MFQNVPVIALLNGVYDGVDTVGDLRHHGDFGLGTWDRLDGEGLVLDGTFYQITADGRVHTPADSARMPFVALTYFASELELRLPSGTTMESIATLIDRELPTVNCFYALRVEGTFRAIETRSLPAQSPPYPPFHVVEETEPKFQFEDVKGTLVGFRSPPYVTNVNVPGYHFHFLTEARDGGGHVLSFVLEEAVLWIDRIDTLVVKTPRSRQFETATLESIDR